MVGNPCNPSPLSVFNLLSLSAPGATAESCPLGSLQSGTVRPQRNVTLQWMHLFSAHVLSTHPAPFFLRGAGLQRRQSRKERKKKRKKKH